MKAHLNLVLILVTCGIYAATGGGGDLRRKKQLGSGTGISFAFPGLNLFGGNNNNNGGNVFGQATFTRTIVSTVSTVTTASFRTCTMPVGAALMPCVGRRKREADIMMTPYNYDNEIFMDHNNNDNMANNMGIEPSASIALIIGTTTITDQLAVSEYLVAHQPSSESIIYPQDITISQIENLENIQTLQKQPEKQDTNLYPSNDSPDVDQQDDVPITTIHYNNDDELSFADPTTEGVPLNDDADNNGVTEPQNTTPRLLMPIMENYDDGGEDDVDEKGRRGLGKTTTVTTVIRVTSVATTLASGTAATLTVAYMGCLPPSLPVSGIPC